MTFKLFNLCLGSALAVALAGNASAAPILEVEGNDTAATAQILSSGDFTLDADANIFNSTLQPHITISGIAGGASFDLFRFTMAQAGTITLDVDSAPTGTNFDIEIGLWDAAGIVLSQSDDNGGDVGDTPAVLVGGAFNSLIQTGVLPAGDYVVGVSAFNSSYVNGFGINGASVPQNGVYSLNISANVPEPFTLSLLGLGLAGLAGYRARRRS